jgi:diacylglycerol kinase family enzyme
MQRVKCAVIVNAAAGAGARSGTEAQLAHAFDAAGAEARIWFAGDGPELAALAERAAHCDAEHVVAGGGDGTINAVATAIIESGKTLGVLPLGTMNHVAKVKEHFSIPR